MINAERDTEDFDTFGKAVAFEVNDRLSERIVQERAFIFKVFGIAASVVTLAFGSAAWLGYAKLRDIEQAAEESAREALSQFIETDAPQIYLDRTKRLYLRSLVKDLRSGNRTYDLNSADLSDLIAEYLGASQIDSFHQDLLTVLPEYEYASGWTAAVERLLPLLEGEALGQNPERAAAIFEMFSRTTSRAAVSQALDFARTGGLADLTRPPASDVFRYLLSVDLPIPRPDMERILEDRGAVADALLLESYPNDERVASTIENITVQTDRNYLALLTTVALLAQDRSPEIAARLLTKLFSLDIFVSAWAYEDVQSPYGSGAQTFVRVGNATSPALLPFDSTLISRFEWAVSRVAEAAAKERGLSGLISVLAHIRPGPEADVEGGYGAFMAIRDAEICGASFDDAEPRRQQCMYVRLSMRNDGSRTIRLEASEDLTAWFEPSSMHVVSPEDVRVRLRLEPRYAFETPLY